jgi:RimJ/RimL family protein N-acetyltransferase
MNILFENITLRAIEYDDLPLLHQMINDRQIEQMTGGWSFPVSLEQQKQWYDSLKNERHIVRCIIDVDGLGSVGTVVLSDIDWKNRNAQIHIKIVNDSKFRQKGIGKKSIHALTQYAFMELNLHCVYAEILEDNLPSRRMFESCCYQFEGMQKDRIYKNGKYHNVVTMSITHGIADT